MSRRPIAKAIVATRLIAGTRAEQVRVRAATRDGRAVVRLDLLERLTSHCNSLTVVGRAILVPVERVAELIEALYAAKVEAGAEAGAVPAVAEDEF